MNNRINIAEEFSETPGGRYEKYGKYSGEEFRNKLLIPRFEDALKKKVKLEINFDGGYGYPVSFLEEAFGGLARKYGVEKVLTTLLFTSKDEPGLVDEVQAYIRESK